MESICQNTKCHFDNILRALNIYAKQAEKCEKNKLYLAACIMYGSALEAALLSYCLSNLEDNDSKYPSDKELQNTKISDLINALAKYKIIKKSFADKIKNFRHLVHPFRLHQRFEAGKGNLYKSEFLIIKNKFYKIIDQLMSAL